MEIIRTATPMKPVPVSISDWKHPDGEGSDLEDLVARIARDE